MYTKEFRDEVMNYYYNVSHSQSKTAIKYGIGKTTVSQWKQEDEGKKISKAKRHLNDGEFSKEMFANVKVEEAENAVDEDNVDISFEINGFKINISKSHLKYFIEELKQ